MCLLVDHAPGILQVFKFSVHFKSLKASAAIAAKMLWTFFTLNLKFLNFSLNCLYVHLVMMILLCQLCTLPGHGGKDGVRSAALEYGSEYGVGVRSQKLMFKNDIITSLRLFHFIATIVLNVSDRSVIHSFSVRH